MLFMNTKLLRREYSRYTVYHVYQRVDGQPTLTANQRGNQICHVGVVALLIHLPLL